jgi:HEAT repeat protein
VDAAADAGDESLRVVFESVLADDDPWIRWKATRALGELGIGPSRAVLETRLEDPDFQVRFEANRVLRS